LGIITLQGVFPKRQARFAEKLGMLVSNELLSEKEISALITNLSSSEKVLGGVEKSLEKLLVEKVPVAFPMAAMFLNEEVASQIVTAMKPEIEPMIKELLNYAGSEVADQISIKEIVTEKVMAFSSDKLEEIILSIMKKELKMVELVGG